MNAYCDIAIETIRSVLGRRIPPPAHFSGELVVSGACFVTLERDGRLLGCVGSLEAVRPLGEDIARQAGAAAFQDPRLPPVTVDDFREMSVKVSVLSPLTPLAVASRAELESSLRPHVDGLLIEAGKHRATFLPSVWEKVPDVATFLDALWQKARLAPGAWSKGMQVATYTTTEYCDPGPRAF